MRKPLFSIIALIGFAMTVMHSCGGSAKAMTDADTLSFDTINVDTIVPFSDAEDSPRCELKLNILCAKGPNSDLINDSIIKYLFNDNMYKPADDAPTGQTIEQAKDSFVVSYIKYYKEECAELARAGVLGASSNYEYVVNTKVINGRDNIVNYIIEGYSYTGGAHGSSFTVAMNFDTATGVCIQKDNAFVNTPDSVIQSKIIDKLLSEYKVKDMEGLKNIGVFAFSDAYVPDNFILGLDSVTFIYMSDEIAPHALGEIRVSLAYPELGE